MSTTKSTSSPTSASAVVITSFPRVPLTTTFTPNADCAGFYESTNGVYIIDPMTSCLPSGAKKEATAYFSPGIICPSGYVSACHDTKGVASITTVTCCPARGDVTLSCPANPESLANVWSTLFCTWIATKATAISLTLSSDGGITSTKTVSFTSPQGFNAYGVRMVHQRSDLITSTPSPVSATTTSSITSTATPPPTETPGSKGTSGSTIAVAVIIPLVVLALLGVAYFWWRKRRQRRIPAQSHELPESSPKWYTSELPSEPKRNELSSEPQRGELAAHSTQIPYDSPPAELPADGRG